MRRRLTIVVAEDDAPSQHLIVTKGAFANVLDICSSLDRDGVEVPLDDAAARGTGGVFRGQGRRRLPRARRGDPQGRGEGRTTTATTNRT